LDAPTRALPLVGGEIHDWYYMLDHLNLLYQAEIIGTIINVIGFLIIIFATIWGIAVVERKRLSVS